VIARRFVWLSFLLFFSFACLAQEKGAEETLSAIVTLQAKAVPNARSAATLGTERRGAGALIREGYVLTIGYLVIEAESVNVTGADGRTVPATVAGYDHASGFGLLKLIAPLAGKPLALGEAATLTEQAPAIVATSPAREGVSIVRVASRRPFSGSWEYHLENAIFTYPPVLEWSGAPLLGGKGELLGIGSLIVGDAAASGVQSPGNMFVPIDLLKPILEDLIVHGRRPGAARPWLGLNTDELRGRLFVSRVSPDGPAARAGVRNGDLLLAIDGEPVGTLADFYRRLWARGAAGAEVPLRVLQGGEVRELSVRSMDRMEYFRPRPVH
jgi:S1-C subfamily serine protease